MPNIKLYATVIAYANYRDNDRMLTLLSPNLGKISVLSRGCRKPKSAYLQASELLSTGEYVLYYNNNRYTLVSANIDQLFYNIRLDIGKFYSACYALELCNNIAQENEDLHEIFNLLNVFLKLLDCSNNDKSLALLNRFIIKCLIYAGYKPRIVHCCHCENKISKYNNQQIGFDFIEGGVLCANCVDENTTLMPRECYLEMYKLAQFRVYDFDHSNDFLNIKVFNIMNKYIEAQLNIKLKTSKFIIM